MVDLDLPAPPLPPDAPADLTAGWQPTADGRLRWWTGRQWTETYR